MLLVHFVYYAYKFQVLGINRYVHLCYPRMGSLHVGIRTSFFRLVEVSKLCMLGYLDLT